MSSENVASLTAMVGSLAELEVGAMKLAKVGERRVAVIRTPTGVYALDNACPHQGYGLVTGSLEGELVTCQWHNWKFRAADGRCVIGEENVACHEVRVDGDEISVTVTEPSAEEQRAELWPSLRRGFANDYAGQMARDVARLLNAGARPEDIVWEGILISSPKVEYGIGHGMAMATDCLTMSDLYHGDEKTLPILQALAGLSEPTRDRPAWSLPPGDASIDLAGSIETENLDGALASTVGQLEEGASAEDMRTQLIEAVCSHHIAYGHGAIYTQKTFELLDRVGWERAIDLLPWLTLTLTYGTREDSLPYMRKAMTAIGQVDLAAMVEAPDRSDTGWSDDQDSLRRTLLDSPDAAIGAAVQGVLDGAGVAGLLDTVTLAMSERLLRYDTSTDFDYDSDFGWLDITHGLTYARAARWAWNHYPSPATARLALFSVFLAHDTGRAEHWGTYSPLPLPNEPALGDIKAAVLEGRMDDAVSFALGGEPEAVGDGLARASLTDRTGAAIVTAHVIKLTQAAREEAAETGSSLPLAAAARFAAAPRLERFVARNAAEAIAFVRTGTPPKR